MTRSKPASSKKAAAPQQCPHPTEGLIDLKSITWEGKGLYLCPHCITPAGTKLLVVREIPKCEPSKKTEDMLARFDSLFGSGASFFAP